MNRIDYVTGKARSVLRSMLRGARSVEIRLGKTPALVYVVFYVGMIFTFGFIYDSLPSRSFYHSTSKYEYQFFNSDAGQILQYLRQEIVQVFRENYGKSEVNFDGWQLDIDSIDVNSLFVGDFPDKFSFKVRVPVTYVVDGQIRVWTELRSTIEVPMSGRTMSRGVVYSSVAPSSSVPFRTEDIPAEPKPDVLFPFRGEGFTGNSTVLPISIRLYNTIVQFGEGYRGFPSQVSGQYWRMLYLSAGIATSSAFGDIVPLTTKARLLVLTEAILAIITVGLFLNALAHHIAEVLKGVR